MDYGNLIHQAWTTTWRYRFLWLLGILAGGSVGLPSMNGSSGGSGVRIGRDDLSGVSPRLSAVVEQIPGWIEANIGWLVLAGVVLLLIALGLFVLSIIAQGGMARATADLALGNTSSFSTAWHAGQQLFWRYLRLWLVLMGLAFAIAFVVAVVVGAIIATPPIGIVLALAVAAAVVYAFVSATLRLTAAWDVPRWLVALGATLFALPLVTVLIVAALGLSIVIAYAQRAMAVEDIGCIAALRTGWRLLRQHLGESALAWLINAALAIGSTIALAIGLVSVLLALFGIGFAFWSAVGFATPTFIYIGLAAVVVIAVGLLLAGIANTFFWNYWTIAYLRLTGRVVHAAA